jgi:hypothetical protein
MEIEIKMTKNIQVPLEEENKVYKSALMDSKIYMSYRNENQTGIGLWKNK